MSYRHTQIPRQHTQNPFILPPLPLTSGGMQASHPSHSPSPLYNQPQEAYEQEQLVALVLQCLAHPAMEVGAYTLPFWYDLAKAFER